MHDSFWSLFIIGLGVISVSFIIFFQNLTSIDEQNYTLLRETTEAAMYDAVDLAAYKRDGTIRIDREKFVENFVRRFAEGANLAQNYKIEIFDVSETPPKVSIRVSSKLASNVTNEIIEFDIVNKLDAILETPY
mgnify:FL=1